MKRYVVGFLFSEDLKNVALIRKNRPEWQKGLLNGIGGHIEIGETDQQAMAREFAEEAGVSIWDWEHVLTLRFPYAEVEFFAYKNNLLLNKIRTCTDEQIIIVNLPTTQATIENIPALLELASQRLSDKVGVAPKKWQVTQ